MEIKELLQAEQDVKDFIKFLNSLGKIVDPDDLTDEVRERIVETIDNHLVFLDEMEKTILELKEKANDQKQ